MEKILINIAQCKVGDVLAQEVFSRKGLLLVMPGVKINDSLLHKLEELGIVSLWIYPSQQKAEIEKEKNRYTYEEIEQYYQEDVGQIKVIINDLAKGKDLDYEVIQNLSDSLYRGIHEKDSVIKCLSTLKAFDEYTYNHSINVALYSMLIAQWLQLSEADIKEATKAGLLHDIGKALVPEHILNKKGKLTFEEFEWIKYHPTYGYEIAKKAKEISENVLKAIVMHHEREDGTGYPMGIRGNQMNQLAKIVAVADAYDAITSERVYKKRLTPFDTFNIIESTGLGYYDTMVLLTFLKNIANYYIGSEVALNTGKQGKVVHVVPHNISRPIVKIGNRYIDTGKDETIKIVALIN